MSRFDRFMVVVEISSSEKIAGLTDAEFRCLVTGVWPIAAKAPIRGCLLVGDHEAGPRDVAYQARCSTAIARRTLQKLRDLGMLENDLDLKCERVHDWDEINPAPKKDSTAAERQQRRRERLKSRRDGHGSHGVTVTGVTPTEVEGKGREEEDPPPLEGERDIPVLFEGEERAPTKPSGSRRRDLDSYAERLDEWVAEFFPGCSPKSVGMAVDYMKGVGPRDGSAPTADELREWAAGKPLWEPYLWPEQVPV